MLNGPWSFCSKRACSNTPAQDDRLRACASAYKSFAKPYTSRRGRPDFSAQLTASLIFRQHPAAATVFHDLHQQFPIGGGDGFLPATGRQPFEAAQNILQGSPRSSPASSMAPKVISPLKPARQSKYGPSFRPRVVRQKAPPPSLTGIQPGGPRSAGCASGPVRQPGADPPFGR